MITRERDPIRQEPPTPAEDKRFLSLQCEAVDAGCTLEYVGTRRMRGYVFKSCDTGPGGVKCMTLDEVDEELDNFRY
ncbi:hypothetical protein LCGC14_2161120 [marine sediment metagenome]|uniref:Uncharacterized protein n=1 Tax=marine sediment metagenome TaxID=412755 RepID=A0A0F9G5K5_9ZZZZ